MHNPSHCYICLTWYGADSQHFQKNWKSIVTLQYFMFLFHCNTFYGISLQRNQYIRNWILIEMCIQYPRHLDNLEWLIEFLLRAHNSRLAECGRQTLWVQYTFVINDQQHFNVMQIMWLIFTWTQNNPELSSEFSIILVRKTSFALNGDLLP